VLVVAFGMHPHQLLMTCLEHLSVASHVVVIAREAEAVGMAAYEGGHRELLVAARCTTMNDNQIYSSHCSSVVQATRPLAHDTKKVVTVRVMMVAMYFSTLPIILDFDLMDLNINVNFKLNGSLIFSFF
jgi:hypothetical protein